MTRAEHNAMTRCEMRRDGEGVSNATVGEPGSGHLLGAIFSATPDAVVVIDASETAVLSNPAVSEQREPSGTIIERIVPL